MASSALSSWLDRTSSSSHQYHTSIDTFPLPNLERSVASLDLEDLGSSRGEANEPPTAFTGLDLIESKIVDHVEQLRSAAEDQFRDMMNSYRDRLFDLEFDTKAAQIRSASDIGVSAIQSETEKGLDQLHAVREDMILAEAALERFRKYHGLDRPADYPRTGWQKGRKWAILILLLVVEALLNGVFFAEGNRLGLLGGGMQAIVFAGINISLAFVAGRFGTTALVHRERLYRWLAGLGLVAWLATATVLNLGIAHYRSAFATDPEHPFQIWLHTMREGWFAGLDMSSIQMIGVGAVFALIALFEARSLGDAYLGYDRSSREFEDRRKTYLDQRASMIEDIRDAYEDAHGEMNEAHEDLTKRRSESRALHEAMARVTRSYDAHLGQLERFGNDLLNVYREENRRARTTAVPRAFAKPWRMARPQPPTYPDARYTDEEVSRITAEAKQELDAQSIRLNGSFTRAMERLKSLDSLEA